MTENQAPDPAQPVRTYVRKKPHFYYDPECGALWFATEAEALAYAAESLKCFAKEARHDGEWPSEVEDMRIGVVTHATAEVGNDDDGYDYKVVPLQAAIPAPEGGHAAVMRQALDALEVIAAQDRSEGFESGRTTVAAIAALRAALAAPAPQAAPVAEVHENGGQKWARLLADLPPGTMLYAQPVQPSVEQWQPIETAPKDRKWVMAWRNHATRALIVRYDAAYDAFEDESGDHVYHLTHWMPHPAAPQTKEPTNDR